jgi:hypothetical protein
LKSLFKLSILLILHLILGNLYSHPVVEKIDTTKYPLVQIHIREEINKPLTNESIRLREIIENNPREILVMDLLKNNDIRMVRLILHIQASTPENNLKSIQLAEVILRSLNLDDSVVLSIHTDKDYFLDNEINKFTALKKLDLITESTHSDFLPSIEKLLSDIKPINKPTYAILIVPDTSLESISESNSFQSILTNIKYPIRIISNQTKITEIIASNPNSEFFLLEDKDIKDKFLKDFNNIRKNPYVLQYETFSESLLNLFPSKNVTLNLKIGNWNFELVYSLSIWTVLEAHLSDIEFFYTVSFCLLFILFIIFYSFKRSQEKRDNEKRKKIIEEKYKADLYYHENNNYTDENKVAVLTTKSIEDDEEFIPENDDISILPNYKKNITDESLTFLKQPLPSGEKYERAFLIQKEGPNPGRQFNLTLEEIYIGKATDNELILIDNSISDKHSKIKIVDKTYYIYDLVSHRGTFVNGKKILRPKPLSDFDEIRIGKALLLFRGNK